eukprot:CAMPEP_0194268456 /NCGR_PEP_ID=MMETSP0169-20130528/2775_1 /TAXON_ID=218684 /ORGANISM="Corethron pennatum, Strain L29A3" /LENGTH=633 /DNA_ID=CAMNT_0039009693 /DNA_START=199 /DNA_END=2100 /DNA_ORIENTATION=+
MPPLKFLPSSATTPAGASPPKSPFFAPRTPSVRRTIAQSPGGTVTVRPLADDDDEHKSSIFGAATNLVNAIVGSGIVGIPFALRESGLVAGVVLIIFVSFVTAKSLKTVHAGAARVGVPSYEMLAEAAFGRTGFVFILVNMFIMAYGAMVSYLMIIRDTVPTLFGVGPDDFFIRNVILVGTTVLLILPISMKRDMADLAFTSLLSVLGDLLVVAVVAVYAPVGATIEAHGGSLTEIVRGSVFRPKTIFVGLGVLSFAFVCQHSAFIVARSLERPTARRWGHVTNLSLFVAGAVSLVCGCAGYLGFLDKTEGDILNSFLNYDAQERSGRIAVAWARGILGFTMFVTYPLESFVARHVCVTLLFEGRRAHEGDDHAVLGRLDRRRTLTLALYVASLVPAILLEDLGSVLAISGSISASSLAYFGPGMLHLAVYGKEFLERVDGMMGTNKTDDSKPLWYYIFGFPIWCHIAATGSANIAEHNKKNTTQEPQATPQLTAGRLLNPQERQAIRQAARMSYLRSERSRHGDTPPPFRPGERQRLAGAGVRRYDEEAPRRGSEARLAPAILPSPLLRGNRGIAAAIAFQKDAKALAAKTGVPEEEGPADQTAGDFAWSVFFICFGCVALVAGLFSLGVKE